MRPHWLGSMLAETTDNDVVNVVAVGFVVVAAATAAAVVVVVVVVVAVPVVVVAVAVVDAAVPASPVRVGSMTMLDAC